PAAVPVGALVVVGDAAGGDVDPVAGAGVQYVQHSVHCGLVPAVGHLDHVGAERAGGDHVRRGGDRVAAERVVVRGDAAVALDEPHHRLGRTDRVVLDRRPVAV